MSRWTWWWSRGGCCSWRKPSQRQQVGILMQPGADGKCAAHTRVHLLTAVCATSAQAPSHSCMPVAAHTVLSASTCRSCTPSAHPATGFRVFHQPPSCSMRDRRRRFRRGVHDVGAARSWRGGAAAVPLQQVTKIANVCMLRTARRSHSAVALQHMTIRQHFALHSWLRGDAGRHPQRVRCHH